MDGRLTTFGDAALLQFQLQWDRAQPTGTAADATRGALQAHLAGRTVWGASPGSHGGFVWTWVELVEHLARSWAYIFIEEGDPLGLGVPPERLRSKAEERWSGTTEERQEFEEEQLWGYLESHDLAAALKGAFPAALWLTREGNHLRASCKGVVARIPIVDAREVLGGLGDAIVARLVSLGDEPRAKAAADAWTRREALTPIHLAEIATGLGREDVESLAKIAELPLGHLAFQDAFQPDEYLAVARMVSTTLPSDELEQLFTILRAQPAVWTGPIDKLSEGVAEILDDLENKPVFEQGRAAAQWLRERLSIPDHARVEPEEILASWKVPLVDVQLSSREIDAVSIWGPRHGPAVIANRRGRHGRMKARRATLAHEIGHLLMDRREALPVAEVLGGRVSTRVEMRARAFAAELLLPEVIAGREVAGVKDVKSLAAVVRRVSDWYGASLEIVAWQAAKAHGRELSPMARTYLKSHVSNPEGF